MMIMKGFLLYHTLYVWDLGVVQYTGQMHENV